MNNLWKPWTITNILFLVQKVDPEIVFTKQERIGKGSFGEVFKGIDNRTQQVKFFSSEFHFTGYRRPKIIWSHLEKIAGVQCPWAQRFSKAGFKCFGKNASLKQEQKTQTLLDHG